MSSAVEGASPDLFLVGLNHRTAALDLRERVVYGPGPTVDTLQELRRSGDVTQALLLSTCNRTEVYAVAGAGATAVPYVRERIFGSRLAGAADGSGELYERQGAEAVRHLFRVACGLDSLVLGEREILGQVKTAYELSCSARSAGTILHRLANRTFHVGKRARTETAIDSGAASVAHAAVQLAEKVFESLEGRGVLLLGAGRNGALCAEHLVAHRVEPLLIANRSAARAEELALRLSGQAVAFERLFDVLDQVDVVISTTGANEPVIRREPLAEAMRNRGSRPLVIIDIAVPRDVAPEVETLPGVFVFDMSALESVVAQAVARRQRAVPAVEHIVATETDGFMHWMRTLDATPTIRDLHRQFETIAEHELARNSRRFEPADRARLDVYTHSLVHKLLMGVTKEIKGYHLEDAAQAERLAALRQLFDLDRVGEDAALALATDPAEPPARTGLTPGKAEPSREPAS